MRLWLQGLILNLETNNSLFLEIVIKSVERDWIYVNKRRPEIEIGIESASKISRNNHE